jgi:tetratricopeptide (TPR) repeat protein
LRVLLTITLPAALACFVLIHPGIAVSQSSNAMDSSALASALTRKADAGVTRALPQAQACYREALRRGVAGRDQDAIRLLEAASQFDPSFPDAHFTLARIVALRQPGRAVAELSEAFRIVARSYPWQRYLLANTLTGAAVVWMVSLLLVMTGIALRHLPHLIHIIREALSRRRSRPAELAATAVAVAPLFWGLGAIPTVTLFAGLTSFRFGKREVFLMALFVVSALLFAGGVGLVAPWAAAPSLNEPSLLVDRATNSGYDADLAAALLAWQRRDATEPLFPFALGSMARRGGDLDMAERQLTLAAVLKPRTSWILNNLGNVYFAREDYGRARQAYEAAAEASPGAVEPHFNLAQVYTKQLMFTEASREQSRASAIGFERVREFSRWSAPQLNRTVMDATPPVESLWALARRDAAPRSPAALAMNPTLLWLARLGPPAPFGLVFLPAIFLLFAGIGQILGRTRSTLHCSNCQRIVCRRCVKRMQQRAFCETCFQAVKDLKSMEFTRILLTRQGRHAARRRTIGQAILTFLLPGAGQTLRGATLSGFLALLVMTTAAVLVIPNGALVPSLDVLPLPGWGWGKRAPLLVLFLVIYAATVARYFGTTTSRVQELTASSPRGSGRAPDAARVRKNRRS